AGQGERDAPLVCGEKPVAAGEGEPVAVTHGAHDVDGDGEVEVVHHAGDEVHLLGILLGEDDDVGGDDVEQFGDDGEHAVEVAGSAGPFEEVADGPGGQSHDGVTVGVELVDGRGEDDDAVGECGAVGVDVARVLVEVFAVTELERVDEDRYHDGVGDAGGAAHEGEVAVVQGAHGGDEGDGARILHPRPHGADGLDEFCCRHGASSPSRLGIVGSAPASAASTLD